MNSRTTIKVYQDLMGENERWAAQTRRLLKENEICLLNFIGSPGSGKTTLLESMTEPLRERLRFAVLEGDIETTRDAERLQALDVPVSQLLSGGACHLEAKLVHKALEGRAIDTGGTLDIASRQAPQFIKLIGNYVPPSIGYRSWQAALRGRAARSIPRPRHRRSPAWCWADTPSR